MNYFEFILNADDKQFKLLKHVYDNISYDIAIKKGRIVTNNYVFNNFTGDITTNIKWTWATNKESLLLFSKIINNNNINLINKFFNNNFKIIGSSFITLYDKAVTESSFHLDINSIYDSKSTSNVLTLIFPIYFNHNMGGLEFYDSKNTINLYKYEFNKAIIWDACKFKHRTQPYTLNKKEKRVLASITLSTLEPWAIQTTVDTLKYQGNIANIY